MAKFTAFWLATFFYASLGTGSIIILATMSKLLGIAVKRAIEIWADIARFRKQFLDYRRNKCAFEEWQERRRFAEDASDEA